MYIYIYIHIIYIYIFIDSPYSSPTVYQRLIFGHPCGESRWQVEAMLPDEMMPEGAAAEIEVVSCHEIDLC